MSNIPLFRILMSLALTATLSSCSRLYCRADTDCPSGERCSIQIDLGVGSCQRVKEPAPLAPNAPPASVEVVEETPQISDAGFCRLSEREQRQFLACTQSENQTACEANGGEWKAVGRAQTFQCMCPTGEGNCSCEKSSDCVSGLCTSELPEAGADACANQPAHCAAQSLNFGCYCSHVEPGVALGLCVD